MTQQLDNNCFVTFPSRIQRDRCSRPCLSHLEPAHSKHWPYTEAWLPQDILIEQLILVFSLRAREIDDDFRAKNSLSRVPIWIKKKKGEGRNFFRITTEYEEELIKRWREMNHFFFFAQFGNYALRNNIKKEVPGFNWKICFEFVANLKIIARVL